MPERAPLEFRYKGHERNIPIARSLNDLRQLVSERTIPVLDNLRYAQSSNAGLALTRYQYLIDNLLFTLPEETLLNFVRAVSGPDATIDWKNIKSTSFGPSRRDFISNMREQPDKEIPIDYFSNTTLVLGPMVAKPKEQLDPNYIILNEVEVGLDIDTCKMLTHASVAIHGDVLLADRYIPEGQKIVTNGFLLDLVGDVFHPYEIF